MRKIAFLFSGQGAQSPGMMEDLYDLPAAKRVFDTADAALDRQISGLCFHGTQEELNLTHNTQPCVLAADIAAFAAFSETSGIRPDAVAGFSLGEYAALYAASAIELEDVFRLIQLRADAMQEAVPLGQGGMIAVIGAEQETVEQICAQTSGIAEPVNYNCPGQIVVSGEMEALMRVKVLCRERKIRVVPLQVSAPFHSSMMRPAAETVRETLSGISLSAPRCPIYMNVDARPTQDAALISEQVIRQTMSPVLWEQTIRAMEKEGFDTFIEFGPGKTLTGFVKRIVENAKLYNVNGREALKNIIEELGGKNND